MKRSMKIVLSVLILMAFITTSLGLTSIAVKSIKLNAASVKISVGKTYRLKVTFTPANSTNKKVTFSSADRSIATVSSTGYIKGIKAGKTVITVVSAANKKAVVKCDVTISQVVKAPLPVKLTIMYGISNLSGIQDNPVAKQIEKKTGVIMDIVPWDGNVANFQAMVAANDLPDVFQFVGKSATFTPDNLIVGKQVIPLDDLITKYGRDITGNSRILYGLNYQNSLLTKKGSNKYYTVCMANAGINNSFNRPMISNYIRWDAYVAAGKPQIRTTDDFLNALKLMQEKMAKTPEGKKVYAMGFWFADDPSWALWAINVLNYLKGYGESNGVSLEFDIKKNNLNSPMPPAMNPNSQWWKSVAFVNKAYRMGLIDPDSFVQKSADYTAKKNAGQYLWNEMGWEITGLNQSLEKIGINKGYVLVPPLDGTDKMLLRWTGISNGIRLYMISSKCKYREKAMMFLNYCASDEGCRTIMSGVEGQTWNYVNGIPKLTDEAYNNFSDENYKIKTGMGLYGLTGLSADDLALDGYPFNLYMSPDAVMNRVTPFEKEAMEYFKFPSPDYKNGLAADTVNSDLVYFNINRSAKPSLDTTLKTTDKAEADYIIYLQTEIYKAVMAKTDDEFKQVQNTIISKGQALRLKERYQLIYDETFKGIEAVKNQYNLK